jgi:hypothetical protein
MLSIYNGGVILTEHDMLLMVQRQMAAILAERDALREQVAALVIEREALRREFTNYGKE